MLDIALSTWRVNEIDVAEAAWLKGPGDHSGRE